MNESTEMMTMSLAAELNLKAAVGLQRPLEQGIGSGRPLQIDASAVASIATPAVQVLSAFVLAARQANCTMGFVDPSSAFVDGFVVLGLADMLRGSCKMAPQ